MSTVAVVLAAEPAEGFVIPRYLADVHGAPMLEGVVKLVLKLPVDEVVVVLGSQAEEIVERIDLGRATIVIDPGWAEGGASPMRAALDLVTRDRAVDHVVLVRGDQPGIEREIAESLIEVAQDADADAVVPKYRYARGWPVVIGAALRDRLLSLEGSLDVLDVIASHAKTVQEVWVDRLEPHVVATKDDLARWYR